MLIVDMVNNLGNLYANKGKLDETEKIAPKRIARI